MTEVTFTFSLLGCSTFNIWEEEIYRSLLNIRLYSPFTHLNTSSALLKHHGIVIS